LSVPPSTLKILVKITEKSMVVRTSFNTKDIGEITEKSMVVRTSFNTKDIGENN